MVLSMTPPPVAWADSVQPPEGAQRTSSVAIYTNVRPDTKRGCSQICSQLQRLAFNLTVIPMDYRRN